MDGPRIISMEKPEINGRNWANAFSMPIVPMFSVHEHLSLQSFLLYIEVFSKWIHGQITVDQV